MYVQSVHFKKLKEKGKKNKLASNEMVVGLRV